MCGGGLFDIAGSARILRARSAVYDLLSKTVLSSQGFSSPVHIGVAQVYFGSNNFIISSVPAPSDGESGYLS